ncbi:hypothetical protein L1987_37889 [Smallanthus sonchifolius]|uniref:Uncharacterized protein n=1 Tax=Smallanthus sonchifolius TaxID=185202 RepID=A0ACB9HHN6_9ASTR|nr:hypothetical protein L1987_37889 [Smallanthus sonchifolius]
MAATGSPSHSPPKHHEDEQHLQNQDPNPTQSQEPEQSPPHPETLESPGVQNSQQSHEHDDTILILDGDSQQSEQKYDPQSGIPHTTRPEPIVLIDDTENTSPPPVPPVMSPAKLQRRVNKRKKAGSRKTYKRKRPMKKIQNLTGILNPIPFAPKKTLDLDKHEDVLKRLGLYDFSKIEFDRSFRTDLIVQLIANYDSKKRGSYVNDFRIPLNRADLARALKLPAAKQDKGSSSVEEVDLDSEVFSDEAIGFIEDFVSNWMVLHEASWVMPAEMVNWTRCIRDGHPEKLDPASLIWYNVEKELSQGDKLVDCYYAPHLQYLIRSQKDSLFKEDDDDDDDGEENEQVDEEKEEQEEKYEQEQKDEKDEKEEVEEEKVSIVQEQSIELTLGTDVEEIACEEVKNDDEMMADAEECKEEMEEQGNFKDILGDHFLQRCQSSDLNNFEEVKVEEVEDEQIEQVEDEEDEVEEEGGERMDEGFDMEANDDSFDRDGLTDNFLQGVETSHNPYNNHGMPSMDLFGSRDGSFMSHGGPSFYNNGSKRVMEPEEDIHHLDQNSKRLKTDEIWDPKQNDIGFCFDQMQQLMQKAKMIHESKERSYENLQYSQQVTMEQLQERQQIMDMIIKSKDEELEKKHAEVFRLERELYLMGDLLAGYRKALNDTRFKFSEYRKRFVVKEEPLYKDAGPGGLVLSTREIEKQRLKQEEEMTKFQIMAKNFEEDCVFQLVLQNDRLLPMVDKLVSIENEVQKLKEIATQRKETQESGAELEVEASVEPEENQKLVHEKIGDENELSVEPEENQESLDEIHENDATMESVPPDADESEEKGGAEEH